MYLVSGANDFHRGWVARVFGFPIDPNQSDDWQAGWKDAEDAPSLVALSSLFSGMASNGQIKIEESNEKKERDNA